MTTSPTLPQVLCSAVSSLVGLLAATQHKKDDIDVFVAEYDQLNGVQCHKGYALAARVVIAVMTDRNPTAFDCIRRGSHSLAIMGHSLGGAVAALIHMFLSVEPEPVPVLYSLGIASAPCIAPAQKACEALTYKHISLCRQHDPIWLASPAQMRDLFVRAVELKLEHKRESLCLHKMQNKEEQSVLAREAKRLEKSLADMVQRGITAQQYVPAGRILLMTEQQALLQLDPGQLPKLTIQIDKLFAQRAHPGTGIAGHAHSLIAYVESLRNVPISLPVRKCCQMFRMVVQSQQQTHDGSVWCAGLRKLSFVMAYSPAQRSISYGAGLHCK